MREYEKETNTKLIKTVCNRCGRELRVEDGYLKEGCFHGQVTFGYFSRRDGETDTFDLCEDCYDAVTAEFAVPVEKKTETEML